MFSKKIRELKREVGGLENSLESWKNYKGENEKLEKEVAKIIKINEKLGEEVTMLQDRYREKVDKITKLEKEVRTQTEADLFFTSSKICAKLLKGKKKEDLKKEIKEYDTLVEQLHMERMAEQQQMPHRPFSPFGGLFGRTLGY